MSCNSARYHLDEIISNNLNVGHSHPDPTRLEALEKLRQSEPNAQTTNGFEQEHLKPLAITLINNALDLEKAQ